MVITSEQVMARVIARMCVPWQWGRADCCAAACAVFHDLFGVDVMAGLRGRYTTARGALRMVRPFGGLAGFCHHLMEGQGAVFGAVGRPGDLGLGPSTDPAFDAVALICVAPGVWAGKGAGTGFCLVGSGVAYRCPN